MIQHSANHVKSTIYIHKNKRADRMSSGHSSVVKQCGLCVALCIYCGALFWNWNLKPGNYDLDHAWFSVRLCAIYQVYTSSHLFKCIKFSINSKIVLDTIRNRVAINELSTEHSLSPLAFDRPLFLRKSFKEHTFNVRHLTVIYSVSKIYEN